MKALIQFLFILFCLSSFSQLPDKSEELRKQLSSSTDSTKVHLYYKHAQYLLNQSRQDEALAYLDSAIQFTSSELHPLIAEIYHIAGICHDNLGDYPSAIENFQLAESYFNEADTSFLLALYNSIGVTYYRLSDYPKFFELAFKKVRIAEEAKNEWEIGRGYNNIGVVYEEMGNMEEAKTNYYKGLKHVLLSGDSSMLSTSLLNIGIIQNYEGKYDSAILLFNQSEKIKKAIKRDRDLTYVYVELGNVYLKIKQYEKAISNYQKSIDVAIEHHDDFMLSQSYYNLGSLLLEINRAREALEVLTKAQEISEQIGAIRIAMQSKEKLYQHYQRSANYEQAFKYLSGYSVLKDSLLNTEKTTQLNNLRVGFELQKRNQETELLKTENELMNAQLEANQLQIRQKNILMIAALITFIILIALVITLSSNLKIRKRERNELMALNNEISLQQTEIQLRNEKLKTALNDLQSTQDQLVESEKMASLGLLSAGVAHEINNPLNFIRGGIEGISEVLRKYEADDNNLDKYVSFVQEGVDRASSIISSLSHFSRSVDDMGEDCDVHRALNNCILILQNKLREKVEVIKNYEDKPILIRGNVGMLHQAFLNILSNSEQAIEKSGKIEISTSVDEDYLNVVIKDTGIGIEKKYLKKIMDPFFTTKPPGKGTGLGLSITYRIINEHGGRIEVESDKGEGTIFKVYLPLKKEITFYE